MIPPYTESLIEFHEWTHCSWLIPIRGKPAWIESTSAVLIESTSEHPVLLPTPPNSQKNEITWTTTSVSRFWNFLVRIREAGNLGPIGLAFHAVPSPSLADKWSRLSRTGNTNAVDSSISGTSTFSFLSSIASIDYIKIYHDWPRTYHLRSLLDAWSFESGEHKIRLLVGAKFVLLDEKSNGVMIL
ncbi:hypothetical protein AN958_00574 [Leucoagaricus sp. SymC.cos]|nr:hypothetical protein AN958_00574 [Leucoagaricus sp. SymC.cos]